MVMINGRIEGLRELAKNADSLKKSFASSTLRTALRNAAKPVRKRARDLVPVNTGALKRAIKTRAKVARDGRGFADVGVDRKDPFTGVGGYYGRFIELGTSQRPARPYLRPAIEKAEQEGEITDAFVNALNMTISRRLGRT